MTSGLAFHPKSYRLATLGEGDLEIRIWDLDLSVLLGSAPLVQSVQHITAKIVLIGEAGVGKTGLGWRLAHGAFKEHPSTHGQQFWVLDVLRSKRQDGAECEAVLWDLAGQPDYRLIHGLFLDDANVALVTFDPTDQHDPLRGIDYWIKMLSYRQGRPCRAILVGARIDRGDTSLTAEEIANFCRDRGITGGYVGTSAKDGRGLEDLVYRMKDQLNWSDMLPIVTTPTFKKIKSFVLESKQNESEILIGQDELRKRLQSLDPTWAFSEPEMMTAVGHLTTHGYVRVLRTTAGETNILLAPELLNNLASSFVLEARRNPKGLGALEEERVLNGDFAFPELAGLNDRDRETLLDAVTVLFLEHNICFRETLGQTTYLIFPELINLKKPLIATEVNITEGASYSVTGAIDGLFSFLVVMLGYTNTFSRTGQQQNQAQYEVASGEICGFRQLEAESPGEVVLELYYAVSASEPTRLLFQGLFERFLSRRDVTVTRYPPLNCSKCLYRQERAVVVRRTLDRQGFLFCCNCGDKISLPTSGERIAMGQRERILVDRQQAAANLRTKFEAAIVSVKSLVRKRRKPPSTSALG